MAWKITNQQQQTSVQAGTLLTVGNTSECELFLKNISVPQITGQIFLDTGIIFIQQNNHCSAACGNYIFKSHQQEFIFQYQGDNLTFLEQHPNDADILSIYQKAEFPILLGNIQRILATQTNSYQYQNVPLVDILNVSCQQLDPLFWNTHDLYAQMDREKYKLFIWCLWAQISKFGLITAALNNPDISEIMINDAQNIYFESKGIIYKSVLKFADNSDLMTIIERMCLNAGRRIDESTPFCDARLEDGSRVHVIIPPLALNGPCLTIRKFPAQALTIEHLVAKNSLSAEIVPFLKSMVTEKKNILISGGTGSGKTTLLNCMSAFIPANERILTIEDAAELKLQQPHVIRLECRNGNIEDKGNVDIRMLVKNALRMRPDRIIVGECRGGEALDMLQAMNTGHDGSMTTIHANTPVDALRRLETLVMFANSELPSRAIREQIASAINLIVQLNRLPSGQRIVTSIQKVTDICETTQKFVTKVIYENVCTH